MKITANSLSGQLDQLDKKFQSVEALVRSFEALDGQASSALNNALSKVYEFGEALLAVTPQPGVNLVAQYFERHDIDYHRPTRENPYVGLVKLAFPNRSDSSRSQYATVLGYAAFLQIAPAAFAKWLATKGIEGWRVEATEAKNSRARTIRNQGLQTRVDNAKSLLGSAPASATVALPTGVEAPEGFALVLAKIDGSNGAQIVQVIQTDEKKLEPVLLGLVEAPLPASNEALAPFLRAIDLIINTTPDKTQGKDRDLLVRNLKHRGKNIATIEAISAAYSFPGANMKLDSHVGELPADKAFVISATDAAFIVSQTNKLTDWTVSNTGEITAKGMAIPIQMTPLEEAGAYRVAQATPNPDKPFEAHASSFKEVANYIAQEKLDNAKKNIKRSEKRAFPASVDLSIEDTRLTIRLAHSLLYAELAETSAETTFDGKTIAVNDLQNLATTLAGYDVKATGWIMDGDVTDAALVLDAHFDNDLLRIVLPTRTGSDYNQVCEALAL